MSGVAQGMVLWILALCTVLCLFPHSGWCVHRNVIQSPCWSRQHFLPKCWEQTDHTTQCKNPQDHHMLWSSSL